MLHSKAIHHAQNVLVCLCINNKSYGACMMTFSVLRCTPSNGTFQSNNSHMALEGPYRIMMKFSDEECCYYGK